jgi:hypothetical protein
MMDNLSDLVLDSNAGARLLQDTFGPDITLAQIRCEACDSALCSVPMWGGSEMCRFVKAP